MAQKNFKKILTVGLATLILSVSALLVTKTNAVFKGPDPVTNGRIVFSTASGKTIMTTLPDGSSPITLFNDPDAAIVGDPVWNPNHTKVAFVMAKNGQTHIYLLDSETPNQTPTALTSGSQESGGTDPSWSPDGDYLLFARQVGSASNIFIMDAADGANQTQLTSGYTTSGRQAFDPQWSPISGSKQIVFTVADTQSTPTINSNIHTAEINSSNDALESGSDVELDGASWNASDGADKIRGEYDPQFSPDGSKVIFVRMTEGGSFTIGTALADNSSTAFTTVIPNTVTGGSVFDPAYSPDGNYVSFEPKNNLLSVGPAKVYNVATGTVAAFSSSAAELDWTYAAEGQEVPELPDVSVECTTEVGKPCTVSIPAYCTNTLETAPLHGQSVVTQADDVTQEGSLTYTPTPDSNGKYSEAEENYVHVRSDNISTASCFVKIKFTKPSGVVPNIPKTGIVGGLAGLGLAAAIAGGAIYAKEYKTKKAKKVGSEK
ncbi:MAG: PD40 domain-containing protein [Candidatus Nomurabacteria bacterium]|nr:MAG: PD40 domain-containing protein [Candidatus Nomurabacteria bacterium]HRV75812.1 hypothetical protein [Candidatus Saccharimonadales bacterium]